MASCGSTSNMAKRKRGHAANKHHTTESAMQNDKVFKHHACEGTFDPQDEFHMGRDKVLLEDLQPTNRPKVGNDSEGMFASAMNYLNTV